MYSFRLVIDLHLRQQFFQQDNYESKHPKNLENNIIFIPEPHSQAPNMYPNEIL